MGTMRLRANAPTDSFSNGDVAPLPAVVKENEMDFSPLFLAHHAANSTIKVNGTATRPR
jgi:hypothetical protein